MDLKKIEVNVVNKYNRSMPPTNALIATTLVNRDKAIWISDTKIKLLKTRKDWIKLKSQVIIDEDRRCYICGDIIPDTEKATIDHMNPRSKNGKDERDNIHCCCRRCNYDKSNMTIRRYYKHVLEEKKINNKYDYLDLKHLERILK